MNQTNANPDHITLELWLRSVAPTVTTLRRDRVVDRVRRLADRNVVDAVDCHGWASVVERGDSDVEHEGEHEHEHPDQPIHATLESFERWADGTDRSLEPCFRTRRAESTITGESTVVCRPPTVALAEYHDGELAHVAPSRAGERLIEIEDRLDALASARGLEDEFASGASGANGTETDTEANTDAGGSADSSVDDDDSAERGFEPSWTRPP